MKNDNTENQNKAELEKHRLDRKLKKKHSNPIKQEIKVMRVFLILFALGFMTLSIVGFAVAVDAGSASRSTGVGAVSCGFAIASAILFLTHAKLLIASIKDSDS